MTMMNSSKGRSLRLALTALALGLAAPLAIGSVATTPASAKEYNKRPFLAPDYNSRVQRAVTHGRTEKFRQKDAVEEEVGNVLNPNKIVTNTGCGKLKVGGVTTSGKRGERVPRENITVVGEVINAPVNCNVRTRLGK
jgi:hypothetical protein